MNVFVLCTGRCGSTTFDEACRHITNFTSGHETRSTLFGPERLDYPDNHIEADNRLTWLLGRLDETYGERAYYVHLLRDPEAVARSFDQRWHRPASIVSAYRNSIHMNPAADGLEAAREYVRTVTANITSFLKDKPHRMTVRLETIGEDFPRFWEWIGAEGDLAAAMAEWETQHNPTPERRRRPLLTRAVGKIQRAIRA